MVVDIKTGRQFGKSFEDVNLDRQIRHKKLGVMTPRQFVNALELEVGWIMDPYCRTTPSGFKDREELKNWCMSHQPFYKQYIPEVVSYFALKYDIPKAAADVKLNK